MFPIADVFMRIAYWLKHPPSKAQAVTMGVVAVLMLIIVSIEVAGYWPDFMQTNRDVRKIEIK